ncbi:hypothetical protein ACIQGZ_12325 [Streptomyces sp. NPDC092296]|uniref:hypothetical protein n=1 Tax=Streptomyces sp. NPDC092296 TaxID=3366012 RepID=UPI003826379E
MALATGVRAAAAALVLLATACDAGGGSTSGGPLRDPLSGTTASGPATASSPSPTATPYGQSLAGLVDPVSEALGRAAAARSLSDLDKRLDDVRDTARAAARGLNDAGPPDDAVQPHRDLVEAFEQLGIDLGTVRSDIDDGHYCATSSALAGLGATKGLRALPKALGALTAAGYRTSFHAPRTGKQQNRRKATGSYIRSGSRTGRGQLTVQNGGGSDAVISLVKGEQTAHSVYVRKGAGFKVDGVRDGTYTVYFTSGSDWDGATRQFTRDCGFTKFDDKLKFTTTTTATQIRWTTWKVSLQPVIGGNASTSKLNRNAYPKP